MARARKTAKDKISVDELAKMLGVESPMGFEERVSEHLWRYRDQAEREALEDGDTEEEAEEAGIEAEQRVQREAYEVYLGALENAAEHVLEPHLLELERVERWGEFVGEYTIVPSTSWSVAGDKLAVTIRGVGSVEPGRLRSKSDVLENLSWVRRYPALYGTRTTLEVFESSIEAGTRNLNPGHRAKKTSRKKSSRKKNSCCGVPTYSVKLGNVLMYEGASQPAAERVLNQGRCPPGQTPVWRVSAHGEVIYEGASEAEARRAIRATPFVASRTQVRCARGPVKARGEIRTTPVRKLKNRLMR